jgi:hypothetical protein
MPDSWFFAECPRCQESWVCLGHVLWTTPSKWVSIPCKFSGLRSWIL